MKTLEYRTIDKSKWHTGEWQNEPDKAQWRDEETGLPCLIVRGPHGAWCGYVGVSKGHPCYGLDYDKAHEATPLDIHGGLTFASGCSHGDETKAICHVVDAGEDDQVWWLGFDCAHCGDFAPAYSPIEWIKGGPLPYMQEEYRNQAYITAEVQNLARQLNTALPGQEPTSASETE